MGLIIVKLKTGKDIRQIESGRTGGSNAMRAAGIWAGVLTGTFDILKAGLAALITRLLFPDMVWLHVFAPVAAVIGHNYSIFLIERSENGKIRLCGGAGGSPSLGGAIGLWFPSLFIMLPVVVIIGWVIGYASLASLSVGIFSVILFSIRFLP